jgi:hypothetical protein
MVMYPKVHPSRCYTFCWSSVETQARLRKHHNSSLYSPRSFPPKGKSVIHYGTLEDGQQTRQAWRNLHNLIGGLQVLATKATKPSRVQGPNEGVMP